MEKVFYFNVKKKIKSHLSEAELNIIKRTAVGSNYIFEGDSLQAASHNTTSFTIHSGASGTNDIYIGSDMFLRRDPQ